VCETVRRLFDLSFIAIILLVILVVPIRVFAVILVSNLIPRVNSYVVLIEFEERLVGSDL
jgi:hypothetical protein